MLDFENRFDPLSLHRAPAGPPLAMYEIGPNLYREAGNIFISSSQFTEGADALLEA